MEFKRVKNVATAINEIISNSFYVLKTDDFSYLVPALADRGLKWWTNGRCIAPDDKYDCYNGPAYVWIDNGVVSVSSKIDGASFWKVILYDKDDVITINDKVYTDEDKAIECVKNFFHPFPSVGDTIFWVSAGGTVEKDIFRDNVFCKRIKELGNYYKTEEEAKIIADKLKEIFKKS